MAISDGQIAIKSSHYFLSEMRWEQESFRKDGSASGLLSLPLSSVTPIAAAVVVRNNHFVDTSLSLLDQPTPAPQSNSPSIAARRRNWCRWIELATRPGAQDSRSSSDPRMCVLPIVESLNIVFQETKSLVISSWLIS